MSRVYEENERNSELTREATSLEQLSGVIQKFDKDALLLLDYDGTLAPTVANPMEAFPDKQVTEALKKIQNLRVVIVTGRPQSAIDTFLPPTQYTNLSCITEHGAYLYTNSNSIELMSLNENDKQQLIQTKKIVKVKVQTLLSSYVIEGESLFERRIKLENIYEEGKTVSIPLHSRAVKEQLEKQGIPLQRLNETIIPEFEKQLTTILTEALQTVNKNIFTVETPSAMCFELKPKFNKGDAVKKYLTMSDKKNIRVVIFAGDSMPGTDDSAADVVANLKNYTQGKTHGFVIQVLNGNQQYAKARFTVDNPQKMGEFLNLLADGLQNKHIQAQSEEFTYQQ